MIVLGSFISQSIGSGLEHSKGILYLVLLEKYSQSAVATSWVLSLSSSIGFLAGPFVSTLCDKLSCRTVAILGALLISVGLMASSFALNLATLYITYGIITGFGKIFRCTSRLIIVGQYFKKRLGLVVALSSVGNGAGSFIFPLAVELLFSEYNFFWTMLILSAISMNLFVAAAIFRPLDQSKNERMSKESENSLEKGHTSTAVKLEIYANNYSNVDGNKANNNSNVDENKANNNSNVDGNICFDFKNKCPKQLRILGNYLFTATCLQVMFHNMATKVAFLFFPAFAVSRGISAVEAAVILSTMGLCGALSKFIMTIVLDFEHLRKYRMFIYSFVVIAMGVVLSLVPSLDSFLQIMTASAVYGILNGTRSQKNIVIVDTLGSENLTACMGWLLFFQGIGSILGPTAAALLYDNLGKYDVSLYLGAVGHFIGGFFMMTGNIWQLRKQSS